MRKVREWQGAGYVHPLTCGKDSSHPVLEPGLRDEKVVLFCPGCDYVQKHIPGAVLRGVPSLPAKWLKITKPENEITVTIYRSAWQALLRGERVAALRVFSKNDLLNHQFGDKPEEFIIRVKITPIVS
jgi:hypothetical protein